MLPSFQLFCCFLNFLLKNCSKRKALPPPLFLLSISHFRTWTSLFFLFFSADKCPPLLALLLFRKCSKTFFSQVLFTDAEFVTNHSFSFPCTAFLLWVGAGSGKRETKNVCCLGVVLVWVGLNSLGMGLGRFLGRHESHSQNSTLTKRRDEKKKSIHKRYVLNRLLLERFPPSRPGSVYLNKYRGYGAAAVCSVNCRVLHSQLAR